MIAPLDIDLETWRTALAEGSFEDVSDALEAVVARLELGQLRLEDSLLCYELGVRLAERSEQILASAELRVSRLSPTGETVEGWDHDDEPFHE